MTAVINPAAPTSTQVDPQRPPSRRSWWQPVTLFVLLSTAYFVAGSVLIMRYNLYDGDGISRVANAGYTLFSRDPHLSAIGFVWNPLPSLVQVPLLPLSHWWPELRTYGLTGVLQSALFMAAAALMVRQIAIDRSTGPVWRWVAVTCFALNPLIVIYGGAGMSEAAEVFCVLWCVRYLLLWVDSQRVGDLAWAGIALGVGYLARYEMVVAAAGAALLVLAVVLVRLPRTERIPSAALNVIILLFPIALAFITWAVTGWIVNGELFATLSSRYGNGSQVAEAVARSGTAHSASADLLLIAVRLFAMQPFVGIAAVLAAALAVLTKKFDALVPAAVCGSVLAFSAWSQFTGTTFGWFRFYLLAIPMVTVIALVCWTPSGLPVGWWRLGSLPSRLGAALLTASLLIGIPVTAQSMLNQDIGNQQLQFGLNSLLNPGTYPPDEQWYRRMGDDDRLLASYLDRKHLPEGSVLMDTFFCWGVWLASDNPKQFVITSDYDFVVALNRPWDFGIQYIVVSNPNISDADAVNLRYPTLWADGAGFASVVYSSNEPGGKERRRVYRVNGQPGSPAAATASTPPKK
ncbi:MAG: hypothetical protein ABWY93_31695 [Mycobacterium sp.]